MKIKTLLFALIFFSTYGLAEDKLTNASYRLAKDLFVEYNKVFKTYWFNKTKTPIDIRLVTQSSAKNIKAINNGLKADIIAVTLASDIDKLVKDGFVDKNWRNKFPNNASPYYTTIAFLVRRGNPKAIKDWSDFIRPKVSYITPDPNQSTVFKYGLVAALFYAHDTYKTQKEVDEFIEKFVLHLATLSGGGDETAKRFIMTNAIDALITFEMEAHKIKEKYPEKEFEVIVPPISILAEFPVAMLDKIVDESKNRAIAEAYLGHMYSKEIQDLFAKQFHYRVGNEQIMNNYSAKFPKAKLREINYLGSWAQLMKIYFSKGGKWDEMMNN